MPLLEAALRDREVEIVVSSSWRFHHDWTVLMEFFPPTLRAHVRGYTGEPVTGRHARWNEIPRVSREARIAGLACAG